MKKLIIFGAGENATLAHYYFKEEKKYVVSAFVVDPAYKKNDTFCSLPLVSVTEMEKRFPPKEYTAFVAIGYSHMNTHRTEKYKMLKQKGYSFASYISPYCHRFNSEIGENCFILEDNTLQPFTKIGNNVVLWSGNHIGHHSIIKDHCFLTSHVVVSGGVTVEESCFIGVNATIRDHIIVRKGTLIGAGALIVKDTLENQVFKGQRSNPESITSDKIERI